MNSPSIFQRAIDAWGFPAQINQTKEECAELIVALSKTERKDKRHSKVYECRSCSFSTDMCANCKAPILEVLTEMADVAIMLEQMKLIYGEEAFNAEYQRKLARLEAKLCNKSQDSEQH